MGCAMFEAFIPQSVFIKNVHYFSPRGELFNHQNPECEVMLCLKYSYTTVLEMQHDTHTDKSAEHNNI